MTEDGQKHSKRREPVSGLECSRLEKTTNLLEKMIDCSTKHLIETHATFWHTLIVSHV
jgi:hypothetical protein